MDIVYTARQDDWPEDPREWDEAVTIRIFRASWLSRAEETEPLHAADEVFARLLDAGADEAAAARGAARYARLSGEDFGHAETFTIHGYSQSDWWDVVAYGPDEASVADAVEQFAHWLRGDVWTVTAWSESTCDRGDTHRDIVDSISGVYADSEDEAIAYVVAERLLSV